MQSALSARSDPPGVFEAFVEACRDVRATTALRALLSTTFHALGFGSYALVTHLPPEDLRSLSVRLHDWSDPAFAHLADADNPLFALCECTEEPVSWSSGRWRAAMSPAGRAWLDRLCELRPGVGVTQAVRCPMFDVSCSLVAAEAVGAERMRCALDVAEYAYHYAQWLQRPAPRPADQITERERQCLYEIIVKDAPPREIADALGVELTTVRSHLRKGQTRMDATNAAHAVWRLIETRQLFHRGRERKPRQT